MLLTTVFLIAASVADGTGDLPGKFPELKGQQVDLSPESTKTSIPPTEDLLKKDKNYDAHDARAINGLLFAALGAFVSVMWRMINRINANALTSRFLATAALRSAIAMMIGVAAAQFDLYGFVNPNGPRESLFFLTGLFTDWALTSLRNRARTVFDPGEVGCDRLPLCLVDGLDDGVVDILDEVGIWDIEHLATSQPAEFAIRTLCPFNRIIDWIDQAILINYIRREGIAAARTFGIRGAMDLAVLFSYTLGPSDDRATDAKTILEDLSKKTNMTLSGLRLVCAKLYCDYTVEQLYRYWQHSYDVTTSPVGET